MSCFTEHQKILTESENTDLFYDGFPLEKFQILTFVQTLIFCCKTIEQNYSSEIQMRQSEYFNISCIL